MLPPLELYLAHCTPTELARYRTFASRVLETRWGRCELRVIGASSMVVVATAHQTWLEVIACAEAPASHSLAAARLEGAVPASAACALSLPDLEYSAELTAHSPAELHQAGQWPVLLEYRFPGPGRPLTRLEAQPGPAGLLVRTLHEYPEADAIVLSETRWHWPG